MDKSERPGRGHRHSERPRGEAEAVREQGLDELPEPVFSDTDSPDEMTSLGFLRGRDADYFVEDDPHGDAAVPIENLYSSAGIDDLHREGAANQESLGSIEEPSTVGDDVVSEERIRESLLDAIENEIGEEADLEISIEGDQITLHGSVSTPEARRAAEIVARNVSGVGMVLNELTVVPIEEQPAPDDQPIE